MADPDASNPYSSPAPEYTASLAQSPPSLYLLWIWLTLAIVFSFAVTPADPITMLLTLVLGILCFSAGCVLGAQSHFGLRLVGIATCLVGAGGVLSLLWNQIVWLNETNICYCLVSITFGTISYRKMQHGRLRIIGCFVVGYVLGTILGPLGTIGGAVTGALLARRSLNKAEP